MYFSAINSSSENNNHLLLTNTNDDLSPQTASPWSSLGSAPPKFALDFDAKDPLLDEAQIQTHTNNHQQAISSTGSHNSRHYNAHHKATSYLAGKNKHLSYGGYGSSSSSNNINLNYIHSLLSSAAGLSKPTSGANSLSNLISINSYYSSPSLLGGASQQQQQQQQTDTIDYHQSQANSSGLVEPPPPLNSSPSAQACGRQQVAGYREPRIVGGNSTYEGEFPWAVSIQRHGNHHCGGVIVGRRWILTAAHCVRSQLAGNLIVRTGGHTLSRSANSLNSHLERDYFVEQIVMHNDFSRYDNLTSSQMKSSANTNNADIALLRLKQEISLNEFAWPVCFPHRDSGNFSGHEAVVVGWGKLNEKSDDFSNELQKVKLTIIDNKLCQSWFRQAGREMPIDERIICAGFKSGGKDACHGDSGGPLLSKINGNYVVVGVVSTGIGCARPLLPGLYSRVSSYINWIERYVD